MRAQDVRRVHLEQLQPTGLLRGHLCHECWGEMIGPLRTTSGHAPLQCPQLRELRAEGGDGIPGAAAETRHKSCADIEHTQVLAAANAVLHNANTSGVTTDLNDI